MRKKAPLLAVIAAIVALAIAPVSVFAATNTNLSQIINGGTFSMGFFDGVTPLTSLSADFSDTDFSFSCEQSTATVAPTAGTEKISISNPKASNVTMDLAGTSSDVWSNGTDTYDYNGANCGAGYLSMGTGVTLTKTAGATDPVVTKNGGSFSGKTSVNVFQTSNAKAWEGDIKNIDLTQNIPAETPAGTYSLALTLTSAQI